MAEPDNNISKSSEEVPRVLYAEKKFAEETAFFKNKTNEARAVISDIKQLEVLKVNPILRNAYLLSIVPSFDPITNYYLKIMEEQISYNSTFEIKANLEVLVINLHRIVKEVQDKTEACKWKLRRQTSKNFRRTTAQMTRDYKCPYQNCLKIYGSDVSMNLHMKIKHNGGNKSDREKLAAQYNNLPIPKITINFPPGYLENHRIEYLRKTRLEQNYAG